MKKIKITTPENIEVEYTLADIGSRTAAAIIDMAIQTAVLILLIIAGLLIINFSPGFWEDYYGWIIGISLLSYAVISYGYFIAMELAMNGMTIGKKILGLRTIRSSGQPITLRNSAIRNLFRIFIDMYGVGAVFIFFTREHKRLGDFAASTIVVAEKHKAHPVSLETVEKLQGNLSYYISEEEKELLMEYFERRSSMVDHLKLKAELQRYFTEKFETAGVLDEFRRFIEEI